jgi:hypothetical protein
MLLHYSGVDKDEEVGAHKEESEEVEKLSDTEEAKEGTCFLLRQGIPPVEVPFLKRSNFQMRIMIMFAMG